MAEFYGTVEGLTQYASDRGTTLEDDDELKEQALVRATIYIDGTYGHRFVGTKASYSQVLAWPRTDATWPDGSAVSGTPTQVDLATYEAAILEMAAPGSLLPTVAPGKVKRRARVEGAVEVEYAKDWLSSDLVEGQTPISLAIEGILRDLVSSRRVSPGILVV